MERICIEKAIKAKTIEKAAEKFAAYLASKGYEWAAEEVVESVSSGYYYCNNATESNMVQYSEPLSPKSDDWSYYWAIDNIDGGDWYAWYIERS